MNQSNPARFTVGLTAITLSAAGLTAGFATGIATGFATEAHGDTAEYQVTFYGGWTAQANPSRPSSAHFSGLVATTHTDDYGFFTVGDAATQGVENVAETGSSTALSNEINTAIAAGNALGLHRTSGPDAEDVRTFTVNADSDFPLLSLITMIAPSADWFVAANAVSLRSTDDRWIPRLDLDLASYDAGTESATGFSSNGVSTNSVVLPLDVAEPNGPLAGSGSIARLEIRRVDALASDFNEDGIVNLLDLDALGANWQMPGTPATGDANGDQFVDLLDLDILGAEWEAGSSFAAALSAAGINIPEPGSLGLVTAGVATLIARRRQQR